MKAGAICCLLLSTLCWGQQAGAALELRLPDSSVFQGSSLSVGRAVDVLVELLCVETSGGGQPGSWRSAMGGEPVFVGLQPFGETQELGLLRIYGLSETQSFECASPVSADTVTVQFVLEDSLFFTEDVPAVAPSSLPPPCSVPDIPAANVTVNEQGGVYYCRVETERGVFRSRTISPPPEPQFRYEPQNITANPVSGTTRAAFFCAVVPSNRLTSIQWEYTGQQFGSGASADLMMAADGILSDTQDGVTIATLLEAGTSLLVIEPANDAREGFYRCVAEFTGSVTLTSARATLLFNDTALLGDVILLPPPALAMMFTVGDMVIVPCVTSPGSPSFMSPINAVGAIGMFTLMIASVTPDDAGQYNCSTQSGSAVVTFNITLLEPLEFTLPLPSEAPIVLDGSDDLGAVFDCDASGTTGQPVYSWLRNGAPLSGVNVFFSPDNRVSTIFPLGADDTGIYQCVAEIDGQPSTLITTSSYLLVPTVTNISVTPASQDLEGGLSTTLTCLAEGTPLPAITWQRNGQFVTAGAVQAATGFRETARSTLTLVTSTTQLTEMIICTANTQTEGPTVTDTATAVVNIATTPVFTRIPQDVVVARLDIAGFTCNAQSIPAPTIAWVDSNGTALVGDPFVIMFITGETVTASSLQFPANLNITGVRCEPTATQGNLQLTNRLGRLVTITIADAPGAVDVSVGVVLSRSAMLSWTEAQSLLPVTYVVEFIRLDTGERDTRNTMTLQIELSPLQPNIEYSVSATPMSRAGEGPTSVSVDVATMEDVPDDPPTAVETTSPELGTIRVEWGPPPPEEQNGAITVYTVQYVASTSASSQRENTTALRLDITITPGESYTVSVAAGTAVGLGPFSEPLLQKTISPAPTFSPIFPPMDSAPTTRTSISFTLPPLPAGGNFSHVWVVAVRLDDMVEEEILSQSPNVIFRDIDNSASYSLNVAAGVPYIAAEGLASLIPAEFILGDDDATRSFNDISLYTNGVLLEGTSYTVFVRAFVHTVGGGVSLSKRQNTPRQYSSFSSSDFLTPVSTVPGALFQVRFIGQLDCANWIVFNTNARVESVAQHIVDGVEELCNCGFSRQSISDDAFQCFSADAVTYRGTLRGTEQASSLQLAGFIEQWTAREEVIPVQGVFLTVDSSCSVMIESLRDEECGTATTDNTAVVAGVVVVIGVLIIALSAVAIVTCVLLFQCRKKRIEGPVTLKEFTGQPSIATAPCPAYEPTEIQSHDYEDLTQYTVPEYEQINPDPPPARVRSGASQEGGREVETGGAEYETVATMF